jgi:hypothetical protein
MNRINLRITSKRFQSAHEAGHATIAKRFNLEINHAVIRDSLDLPGHINPHVSLAKPKDANTHFFAGGVAGVLFVDFPNLSRELFDEIMSSTEHLMWYTKGFDEDLRSFKEKITEQDSKIHKDEVARNPKNTIAIDSKLTVPKTFVDKIYESYAIIRDEGEVFRNFAIGLMRFDFIGVRAAHYIFQGKDINIEENKKDISIFLSKARNEQFDY